MLESAVLTEVRAPGGQNICKVEIQYHFRRHYGRESMCGECRASDCLRHERKTIMCRHAGLLVGGDMVSVFGGNAGFIL